MGQSQAKFKESERPSRANASESVGLQLSWRDRESHLKLSRGCQRAHGVRSGLRPYMQAHVGVAHLSNSFCGEDVFSPVSFLAALLHLPPFSDSGLVVMENSVETKGSGPCCPGSSQASLALALVVWGSFCLLDGSRIN